jgi:hypothetical protein
MNSESNATFSASIIGNVTTSTPVRVTWFIGNTTQTSEYTHTAVLPKK